MSQDSREQFEAWLVKTQSARMIAKIGTRLSEDACRMIIKATWLIREGDGYGPAHTQQDWETWQASREAVVVVLPERLYGGDPDPEGPDLNRLEVIEAIEAAGVKVAT